MPGPASCGNVDGKLATSSNRRAVQFDGTVASQRQHERRKQIAIFVGGGAA